MNAMRVPSGENTGSQFWPTPLVGVSMVPAKMFEISMSGTPDRYDV